MKKILSLLLTLTLVFALVACSSEKDTSSEDDTSTPTQTESTDTTDTQTSETNTNESSSDTETPSNSTSTPTTNTNKPNTNNKDNTTSNKPSTTSSTPTTSKPAETDKTNLINQENIRHEQKITELQNKKQSTTKFYDDLIEKCGGISLMYVSIDYARELELSRQIFDLEISINQLKNDTSQKALQKRTQKERELAAAEAEIHEIREKAAKKNEIIRLYTEKNTELSKIDTQITEENNLYSQNLEKLK